ncbi:RNA-binding protein 42-like [Ruditapes philippinarum]|uniref:RNA-binding protein 42-like n=1 Tax=Ruditapes philippinarum TaxID=129788 RepID=UPI00295A644D|nr:RNA-binding protein 42-like [Ruditapes philippinarum]
MSHISQQRLIEMEAEMDRFEQEILSEPSASDLPRVVIGSNTYHQVSAQLKMLRAQSGMSIEERQRKQQEPPPPPSTCNDFHTILHAATVRHRAPPPPPNRPPMAGPPRMRPPPPHARPPLEALWTGSNGTWSRISSRAAQWVQGIWAGTWARTYERSSSYGMKDQDLYARTSPNFGTSEKSTSEESKSVYTVTMPPPIKPQPEPDDDLHVADMDIDSQIMSNKKEKKEKKKKFIRMAAGTTWEDPSLGEWDPDDFRLFCGDLGNEVTDEVLARAFSKFTSFVKAKVVRDKRSNKTKGYGFVSFKDPTDYVRAMREMNGKYVGNRPIKLRKSNWKERNIDIVKRKDKEKKRLGLK